MKNILHPLLLICVLSVIISCKKTDNTTPVINPVTPVQEVDKIQKLNWSFDTFYLDDNNVSKIFPGAIFIVNQNEKGIELTSVKDKYTPLPITASLSLTNTGKKIFNEIPSAEGTLNYIKNLNTTNSSLSLSSSEEEFKDYNIVKYFLSNNTDARTLFEKIGISSKTRITKKHAIFIAKDDIKFTFDMDIPNKAALISIEDEKAINTANNMYYVNGVDYGSKSLILAEGDADYLTLKKALMAILSKQDLTTELTQAISTAKVTIYARGGAEKSFIRVTNNLNELKSAISALDAFNSSSILYPISYSLASIKNFSLFQYKISIDMIM